MIITNAAPGWVEASCQQFMPALVPFVESVPLFARPVSALMSTWKLDAFAKSVRLPKSLPNVHYSGNAEVPMWTAWCLWVMVQ